MATKTATRPSAQKKPAPAPVRPQSNTATKKPVPPAVKPQQTTQKKKPVPPQVRPQSTARTTASTASKAPAKAPSKGPSTASKAPSQAGGLKAGQAVQSKPQGEQGEKAGNWISRMVQGQVQRVGDYAGGYVGNVGNGVNKIGEGIGGKYATLQECMLFCIALTKRQNCRSGPLLGSRCRRLRQRYQRLGCGWWHPSLDGWQSVGYCRPGKWEGQAARRQDWWDTERGRRDFWQPARLEVISRRDRWEDHPVSCCLDMNLRGLDVLLTMFITNLPFVF